MGVEVSKEERKELVELAIAQGLDPDYGWYLHKAVDLVRNYMKRKGYQVQTFQIKMDSEIEPLLTKNYSIVTGYGGNKAYNEDRSSKPTADEGYILNGSNFGDETYHHAIRIKKHGKYNEKCVVDNYETSYRIYELEKFKEVLKSHYFTY